MASSSCSGGDPNRGEVPAPAEPTREIESGGELVFGIEEQVRTLAPGEAVLPSEVTIALGIYDPLMTYVDGKVEPFLARSVETNDQLTEYTITLRDDVTFHDGTPLDADAVVRHFDRLKDPATRCSCFAAMAQITSMETPDGPDGLTVVFNLGEPDVRFPDLLAGSGGYIESPAAAVAGLDFAVDGVGTGPFELDSHVAGERTVVVANPDYWGTDEAGNQLPYLDKITFVPIAGSEGVEALENDGADIFQTTESKVIKQAGEAGFAAQKINGGGSFMLLLNNSKAPFDDVRARRALAFSLDRDVINERAYDGVRAPSYSSFPPASGYHNPDAATPRYDPERAKELVDEIDGLEFTIDCVPSREAGLVLPIIEQLGTDVGMTITVEDQDPRTHVDRLFGKRGDYDAACFQNPDLVDPDAIRPGFTTGDPGNLVFYSNREVDQLLDEARQTIDFDTRKERYDRVQEILASEVPVITIAFEVFANVYDVRRVGPPPDGEPGSRGAINPGRLFATAG